MGGYAGWWSSGRTEEQGHLDMNVRVLDGNDKDALGSPRLQALSCASGSDGGAFAFEGVTSEAAQIVWGEEAWLCIRHLG